MASPTLAQFQQLMDSNLLSRQLDSSSESLMSLFESKIDENLRENEAQLRLDIYRNNVIHSLKSAIGDLYPVVKKLIGDDCFDGAAIEFVRETPPTKAALLDYGHEFCEFIAVFEPCRHLHFLRDVAQLEFDYNQAYHSADGCGFDTQQLAEVAPEKLGDLSFNCHPSLHLLVSRWPVDDIWHENQQDCPATIDLDNSQGVNLLIYRPELSVQVINLDSNCFIFLRELVGGVSINQAWAEVIKQADEHNRQLDEAELSGMLGYLFNLAVFTSFAIND